MNSAAAQEAKLQSALLPMEVEVTLCGLYLELRANAPGWITTPRFGSLTPRTIKPRALQRRWPPRDCLSPQQQLETLLVFPIGPLGLLSPLVLRDLVLRESST